MFGVFENLEGAHIANKAKLSGEFDLPNRLKTRDSGVSCHTVSTLIFTYNKIFYKLLIVIIAVIPACFPVCLLDYQLEVRPGLLLSERDFFVCNKDESSICEICQVFGIH